MAQPLHNASVVHTQDVPNDKGGLMRVRVLKSRKRGGGRYWLTRGYVEADGKTHYRPHEDGYGVPSTTDLEHVAIWIRNIPHLAWAEWHGEFRERSGVMQRGGTRRVSLPPLK